MTATDVPVSLNLTSGEARVSDTPLLPEEFADLEPVARVWSLRTEAERYARRLASTMDELQEMYDTVLPRVADAKKYLDSRDFADLSDQDENLLTLLYSLITVSFPVECFKQPNVPDTGAAYLDLVDEPTP